AFTNSLIELNNDQVRLVTQDHVDDDYTSSGFLGGIGYNVVWDTVNQNMRISQSGVNSNYAELNSSWTPQWSSMKAYLKMNYDWADSRSSNHGSPINGVTFTYPS